MATVTLFCWKWVHLCLKWAQICPKWAQICPKWAHFMPQVNLENLCPKWARIYAPSEPLAAARPSAATTVASREVAGCLAPNGPDHNAALHGDHAAVRDGLHHQPQPWHFGEDAKGQEQGQDAGRPEEGLKGPTWHRAAVASIQGLQGLTKRTLGVCSRRRSAETKGFERQLLVDVPSMWKSLATFGMGAGSRDQHWSGRRFSWFNRHRSDPDSLQVSKVPYPSRLPHHAPDQIWRLWLSRRRPTLQPKDLWTQWRHTEEGGLFFRFLLFFCFPAWLCGFCGFCGWVCGFCGFTMLYRSICLSIYLI